MVERTELRSIDETSRRAGKILKDSMLRHDGAKIVFGKFSDLIDDAQTPRQIFEGLASVDSDRIRRYLQLHTNIWVSRWTHNGESLVSRHIQEELERYNQQLGEIVRQG